MMDESGEIRNGSSDYASVREMKSEYAWSENQNLDGLVLIRNIWTRPTHDLVDVLFVEF